MRFKTAISLVVIMATAGVGYYLGSHSLGEQKDIAAVGQDVHSVAQRPASSHKFSQIQLSGSVTTDSAATPPITTSNAPPPTPTVIDGVHMRYNPYQPSDGPYPVLKAKESVWIDASIDQQLIYICHGDRVLYTMIMSSGIDTAPDTSTPLGVYHIQGYRGTWFFARQYNMGARYWVSWLGDGAFLFHSVPMNIHHQLLPAIAAKLGHPASVGCFQLTIPDAQWIYEHIPYKTTVVVEQAPVALQAGHVHDPSPAQQAAITSTQAASGAASVG